MELKWRLGPAFPVKTCNDIPLPKMLHEPSDGEVKVKLDAYPAQNSFLTMEMNSKMLKLISFKSKMSVS